jgi:hypothetical protein
VDALSQGLKTLGYKMDRAYGSMWMRNVGMLVFVLVGENTELIMKIFTSTHVAFGNSNYFGFFSE